MNSAKVKQVAFIGAVAIGALLLLNTLSKHSTAVQKVRDTVENGL